MSDTATFPISRGKKTLTQNEAVRVTDTTTTTTTTTTNVRRERTTAVLMSTEKEASKDAAILQSWYSTQTHGRRRSWSNSATKQKRCDGRTDGRRTEAAFCWCGECKQRALSRLVREHAMHGTAPHGTARPLME